jgi:hypothetical protein
VEALLYGVPVLASNVGGAHGNEFRLTGGGCVFAGGDAGRCDSRGLALLWEAAAVDQPFVKDTLRLLLDHLGRVDDPREP